MPATKWEVRPIIWGWTCELADGSGLSFGGVHQTSEDGRAHTSVKIGADWRPLWGELRQNNPLQRHFDAVWALRNASKDTLARARHLYFEGKLAADEAKILHADINPAAHKLAKDLAALVVELKAPAKLDRYEAGQVAHAVKHVEVAAEHFKSFGSQITVEQLIAMRRGQIALERASEMLDAEPPPRALSLIAWDAKTKVYALFGGDHTDYLTNDLWIFDPAKAANGSSATPTARPSRGPTTTGTRSATAASLWSAAIPAICPVKATSTSARRAGFTISRKIPGRPTATRKSSSPPGRARGATNRRQGPNPS